MGISGPPGPAWLWRTAWAGYESSLLSSKFQNYLATEVTESTELIPAFSEFILERSSFGPQGPRIPPKSFKLLGFFNDM